MKIPAFRAGTIIFYTGAYKPNSVSRRKVGVTVIYLGLKLLQGSSDSPGSFGKKLGAILHTRKYFAVSAGLNRVVSVRNSGIAPDGHYPLRFPALPRQSGARGGLCVRTFLTPT